MSDWRKNPNLVECFENCVAMFKNIPIARPISRGAIIKQRRKTLGLSQKELAIAAGYTGARNNSITSGVECDTHWYQRIADTLDRLEAERAQSDAAE